MPGDLFLAEKWHFAALTGEPVYDRIPDGCRVWLISPPALGPGTWTDGELISASAVLGAYLRPVAEGLGYTVKQAEQAAAEQYCTEIDS